MLVFLWQSTVLTGNKYSHKNYIQHSDVLNPDANIKGTNEIFYDFSIY